jgi:regulator of replication initiation timing
VIEQNLMQLNLEKDKAKDELSKIPSQPKKAEQIRRREYLEQEVATISKQIGVIKHKLREMNAV